MKFRAEDSLLSLSVIPAGTDPDVFVVFESGLAKRSKSSEWTAKGRGILGVAVAKLSERGGDLVGALTVDETDEVLVVMERGNIVRSRVAEVRLTGRNTMGVSFATPRKGDAIVAVARNSETAAEDEEELDGGEPDPTTSGGPGAEASGPHTQIGGDEADAAEAEASEEVPSDVDDSAESDEDETGGRE